METFIPIIAVTMVLAAGIVAMAFIAGRIQRPFYTRFDRVRQALPGYNCGACGLPECIDYAAAVARGNASPLGCIPGGPGTAHAVADILGTVAEPGEPVMAAIHCKGGNNEADNRARYEGIPDCHAALLVGNGTKTCIEGCLGLGSCVRACPFGALSITGDAVAEVDRQKCMGCGMCLKACPRGLISLIPHVHKIYLACSNHDCGEQVSGYCTVGCTACGACVNVTPSGAVAINNNLPRLDYAVPGENFIAAAYQCPSKCFVDCVKARPKANIDTKCNGCGECRQVCPVEGAVSGENGKRHVIRKELCIGCGRCLTVCPVRAIALWGSLGYVGYETKYRSSG